MNEHSGNAPLLPKNEDDLGCLKKTSLLLSSSKWIIKAAILMIFAAWATFLFLFPLPVVNDLFEKWTHATEGTIFGLTGSIFLLFSAPVLIIAFLSIAYLIISGEEDLQGKKTDKHPRFSLWTFPVLVDGPFGVVSAAEIIGILLFSLYIIWAVSIYTIRNQDLLSWYIPSREQSAFILEMTGLRFGFIGLMCLAFLFLPVSRGSVLLRFIHIPFEHATKYHVWLGHLTMFLFTLHGLFYVIAWAMEGRLIEQLKEWKSVGIANLAGVISLLAGLLMWVTSLPGLRRINFELFFYTHQLYVVFVVFLALHVGDFIFAMAAAGIFLFMLDRFLRFCQSRRTVDILSAKCFPCGTVELILSKPANLHYNALHWVFIQVRELSWLQWHPFSVSSSPMEGKHHLSILIKVLGGWTGKLREHLLRISDDGPQTPLLQSHSKITASVEGPYGHESPYHLTYENLILVAGGIGISPFLAILSDILHHLKEGKPCLPKNILIVWAIKKSDELPLLQTVDMESICPFFSEALNLEIQTYVTRQSEPALEEGKVDEPLSCSVFHHSKRNKISVSVGTGNIIWSGMYVMVSTIGLVVLVGLLNYFYINPYQITYWWYKGLLFVACMIASVVVFGGLTIGLWHLRADAQYRVFYAERSPWWLVIKANGAPGHGAKLYDNSAMENLHKSIESIRRFRAAQFDLVKSGYRAEGEVISVNMVFLKAGTPSPTGFVMNLQPSEAVAGFDIRVPPTADSLSLERRIAEEWAPISRNMTFEFIQKSSVYDKFGKPVLTALDDSNPWWTLLQVAIKNANGILGKPEIFPASTDARYFRDRGLPAIGFSPMANTPILLHDHNEFLNKDEYLKGIEVYESIIKTYSSFDPRSRDGSLREEL